MISKTFPYKKIFGIFGKTDKIHVFLLPDTAAVKLNVHRYTKVDKIFIKKLISHRCIFLSSTLGLLLNISFFPLKIL